jgi:hypothetical protein
MLMCVFMHSRFVENPSVGSWYTNPCFFRGWGEVLSHRTCHKQVMLERLGDISVVYSHCCLMIQDHVTCIFMVVEVWTEF